MASKNQQRQQREARGRLQAYTARQEVHARGTRRRMRDNIAAVAGVVVVAGLAAGAQILYFSAGPGAPLPSPSASVPVGESIGVPDPDYAQNREWTGELSFNDDVVLGIELDGLRAPQAVSAFLADVESGYYPGTNCHRLSTTPGFELIQCGSIDGAGGPDPDFSYGPIENAPEGDFYPSGTIAMARAPGDPYSMGHQFFIVLGDVTIPSDVAGGYTVIGSVTSGLEGLWGLVAPGVDPERTNADGTGFPLEPVEITGLTLE